MISHRFPVRIAAALVVPLVLMGHQAMGQTSIENTLKQFSGEDARGYIQPFADLFGANMNAGFYHNAQVPTTGLTLSLDIVAMGSLVGDDQKSYTAHTPAGFSPTTFSTATIFGGKGSIVKNAPDTSLQYKGSDGIINTSIFPSAVPQLTIGSIFGTKAIVRFLTTPKLGSNDDVPEITLFAIGAQHSVSQYLPSFPLDLSAGIFYSSFKVGDIMKFSGVSIGGQVSKSFSVLRLYGGLAWEKTSMTLEYTSTAPGAAASVKQDLDGANTFRVTGGLCLHLGFFNIFADANAGSITNFSGGISFGN
jgi:Family of unknown function (DUF6588)